MTLISDYSFARPSPAGLKAAGYDGVMRYLSSGVGGNINPKDLTKPEAVTLLAAGLSIGLVWETFAKAAAGGYSAGVADAHRADAQADALGYPTDAVIFYAVDYDAAPAAVATYFAGVQATAHRPVGVYGSARVVEGVPVQYKWQASAWSGSRVSPVAHLYQRQSKTGARAAVSGTDENVLLKPFPMWDPVRVTPPVVVSRDDTRKPIVTPPSAGVVKAIQRAIHVNPDGKWGNETSRAATAVIRKVLRPSVTYLQGRVGVIQDGAWGPKSEAARIVAIKAIQRAIGVVADGLWGPKSQAAWNRAYFKYFRKY